MQKVLAQTDTCVDSMGRVGKAILIVGYTFLLCLWNVPRG